MVSGTMMSCCLICAAPSTSARFTSGDENVSCFNRVGGDDSDKQSDRNDHEYNDLQRPIFLGNGTIKEQLQVIFILRDILGLKGEKVEELINASQFHSGSGIQLCGSCGENAKQCHEAVLEIAKLERKVANLSSTLKGKIYETWMEEGDGKESPWGQIRLEVLRERGFGGIINAPRASSSSVESSRSTLSSRAIDVVQIDRNLEKGVLPRVDVIDKSTNQSDEESGVGDADMEASFEGRAEVEEQLFVHSIKIEQEEVPSRSSSNVPVIINTYGPICPSEEKSPCDPRKNKENLRPTTQSVALFKCLRCTKQYRSKQSLVKHTKTHLLKYICKTCKRSYSFEYNFKRHLKKKICLRPVLSGPKTPCRYCGHEFYAIANHEKACIKNQPGVPKTPCKHCGLQFVDIKRHERVCKKNDKNKPDDSWKQHLQLETVSDDDDDGEKESDSDSDSQM